MKFSELQLDHRTIAFHTLGCKVNIYETEVYMERAKKMGAVIVPFDSRADYYLVNTCTVTNIADRKSRQMIRRAKSMNPDAVVLAAGCFVRLADPEKLREIGVDGILLPEEDPEDRTLSKTEAHTRADVKVQDGCDRYCTYCVIPFARGNPRSKPVSDVVSELRSLSGSGTREAVLTGINMTSYGKDLPERPSLIELLEAVHEVPGIERIRVSSLEPTVITEDFARRASALPKLCPHFHLSLQSGSDPVLRRMNRRYTTEDFRQCVSLLRRYFGDPALTTDVITGFPGETEEEFRETRAFINEIGFYELHVFPYSRRKGTVADRMEGQLPERVKKERAGILIADGKEMAAAYIARRLGKTVEVLTEEPVDLGGRTVFTGYTREYIRAMVLGNAEKNEIVTGELLKKDGFYAIIKP